MRIVKHLIHINLFISCIFISLTITSISSYAINKKIRVGILFDDPPFSFISPALIDPRTIPRGLSVDIANGLLDRMDLSIPALYPMDNLGLIEALNNGHIDMIVGVFNDSFISPNLSLIETNIKVNRTYFINREYPTIATYKNLPGKTVAIEKERSLTGLLPSKTNINFIETQSQEEALALVDSGEAQVYISDNNITTIYIMHKEGFRNIKEVEVPIETVPMVIVVNKRNPEILSSMEIAYEKLLEDKEYSSIINRWIDDDFGYAESIKKGVDYFLGGTYIRSILTVVMLSLFVLLWVVLWNYLLKKKVLHVTKDLQVSEQKYRDLIESSPDMIHLVSPKGEIRLMNEIALRNLGYNKKEITSLRLHDLVLPEQSGDVTDFIDRAFLTNYSNKEFTLIAKNGDRINVEVVAAILHEADSTENLACCFSRDLTERKHLEEELIHSDRLAIIGRMAAGIAHEINNPLWIILSNTEDMLSHQLNHEELHECLKSIERNGLRAAKSIEDLLTFARPAPMKVVAIDLIKLIEDSLIFLKQRLKKKNIRVEKNYSSESIYLQGDEPSIQQLLINIILNAVQALDNNGSIIISVSITEKYGDREIVLEIRDNGRGIPDKELQYIFNPFYTSGKTKGFGLGLFMSKIIVEKHHGDISVRSQLGKGSVFTICFPAEVETKPELQKSICEESINE